MLASSHVLDRVSVTFDDDHAVADAGLILPATLIARLGLGAAADELVSIGYRPGRKVTTIVHGLLAGADCIDDLAVLRAGATERILPGQVMAPSTVGTWLRSLTFGHIRQLDKLTEQMLTRAWKAGAGPGAEPTMIDIDSTVCEVHGYAKQGAAYGYTRQLGYHPILATRADTGEVLHTRMRKGSANTMRGAERFVLETIGRIRRAGATGQLTLRADSGFWANKVIAACADRDVRYSITVRQTKQVRAVIETIDEAAWTDIDYTAGGRAQVAETVIACRRLIVRRTRLTGNKPSCSPIGATTPSSPTVPATPWSSTPIIAITPSSSSPSATSNKVLASPTAHQECSTPTPPGSSWPPSPTTCCAGPPRSARSPMAPSSPKPSDGAC